MNKDNEAKLRHRFNTSMHICKINIKPGRQETMNYLGLSFTMEDEGTAHILWIHSSRRPSCLGTGWEHRYSANEHLLQVQSIPLTFIDNTAQSAHLILLAAMCSWWLLEWLLWSRLVSGATRQRWVKSGAPGLKEPLVTNQLVMTNWMKCLSGSAFPVGSQRVNILGFGDSGLWCKGSTLPL